MRETMNEIAARGDETHEDRLTRSAVDAMRASVKLSNDIMGVMDLLQGRGIIKLRLTDINRTATIKSMRRNAEAVIRFINSLEGA